MRDGVAAYRGRIHDPQSLSLQYIGKDPTARKPASTSSRPDNTLRVVTWNCGGLHQVRYAELLAWLDEQDSFDPVHVMCIQETHWPYHAEYSSGSRQFVHSSSGTASGGVLFIIHNSLTHNSAIRYAEVLPGRLLHLRIESSPPMDFMGVYQHSWNPHHKELQGTSDEKLEQLLRQRACVWDRLRSWTASIPARNKLVIVGDFNCTLTPSPPNVGPGTAGHRKTVHKDAHVFQNLVTSQGLVATNTWGTRERAGTFLQPTHPSVQLDFLLTRLPCQPRELCAKAQPHEPVVHPTGFRHVPVSGRLELPVVPKRKSVPVFSVAKTLEATRRDPLVLERFRNAVAAELPRHVSIDACLRAAWALAARRPQSEAPVTTKAHVSRPTLKDFWALKHSVRLALSKVVQYHAPVIWSVATASPTAVIGAFPSSSRGLRPLLHAWRASIAFCIAQRRLRQHTRQQKNAHVESLIREAHAESGKGLTAVHRLTQRLKPKNSKRSIHFRRATGELQTPEEELTALRSYFQDLYESRTAENRDWSLQQAFDITDLEVHRALSALMIRKALPPGHAPALLWRAASDLLHQRVKEALNSCLSPGQIELDADWNKSYLTLMPKVGKPPSCPANLRPINLLPAFPKMLARIAADRLKPLVARELHGLPQYAYSGGRQTSDSLDRVLSHCQSITARLAGLPTGTLGRSALHARHQLTGGLQLSLDLKKAFDRLPRSKLLLALQRVEAPPDLVSLVMYIHDSAELVVERHGKQSFVRLGRGIRQGCGLSPILWLAFTVLVHDVLGEYLLAESLTGFADDYHCCWEVQSALDFHNACKQICRIIIDLESLGMEVSVDKTVILMAIKGASAAGLLQQYTCRTRDGRYLLPRLAGRSFRLPIRRSHSYLGVKIGYGRFIRDSVTYRIQQSWVSFNRLRMFLKHKALPLSRRVALWQSCVWSIMRYGLPAVGVDARSASILEAAVAKQLRVVARSPAHVTHETNRALLDRLGVQPPLEQLARMCKDRMDQSRSNLSHLLTPRILQWQDLVLSSFAVPEAPRGSTQLTEVTQVLRIRCQCRICGQAFPSTHALSVHMGKSHAEAGERKEQNPTVKNRRKDEFRQHSLRGRPQCRHCRKSFYGWPQFMGHFSQKACPILHQAPAPASSPAPTNPPDVANCLVEPLGEQPPVSSAHGVPAPGGEFSEQPATRPQSEIPLLYRPELQQLATRHTLRQLATEICRTNTLHHCPECFQYCVRPSYVARHAVKMHTNISVHQTRVLAWIKQRIRVRRPCEWCLQWYSTPPRAHIRACPVLWVCGQFLARFDSLEDRGQSLLDGFRCDGRAPECLPGVGAVLGNDGPEQALTHTGNFVHEATVHRGPGGGGTGAGGDGPGSGEGEEGTRVPRAGRDGAQVRQGRHQGPRQPKLSAYWKRTGQRPGEAASNHDRSGSPQPDPSSDHLPRRPRQSRPQELVGRRQPPSPGPSWPGWLGQPVAVPEGQRPPRQPPRRPTERSRDPRHSPARAAACHGAAPPTPRRCAVSDVARHRIHILSPNQGVRQSVGDSRQLASSCPSLACDERAEPCIFAATDARCAADVPFGSPVESDAAPRVQSGGDAESSGYGPGRGQQLCVFAMGCVPEKTHQGSAGAASAPDCGSDRSPAAESADLPGYSRQVPCTAQARAKYELGCGSLQLGGAKPQSGGDADVWTVSQTCSQQLPSPHRLHDAPLEAATLAASPADQPHAPEYVKAAPHHVLGLVLSNSGNYCYSNATLVAVLWCSAFLDAGLHVPDASARRLLKWLVRKPQTVTLWSVRAWQALFRHWRQAERQHDSAEFLQALGTVMASPVAYWQARVLGLGDQDAQVCDHGSMWPLILPTFKAPDSPEGGENFTPSLQQLLVRWRGQPAAVHAALMLPPLLPVQVGRFDAEGRKLDFRIRHSRRVHVPYFVDAGLRTASKRYETVAVIYHLGPSVQQGHYRAILCVDGCMSYNTDDNQPAMDFSSSDQELVERGAYLFLLRLVEH